MFVAYGTQAAVENGATAPAFTLSDIHGNKVSLADHAGKWVVLEWVNPGCPFVMKFYNAGAMQKLQQDAAAAGVVWLVINSTNPQHGDYQSPEKARAWTAEHKVKAPWLLDPDGKVGKAYGAVTTPHMYVISPEGKLVYQGAIDSIRSANSDDIAKADNFVLAALAEARAGKAVSRAMTRPYGCSIKYP
jgi:peroxiredoxin